jgi:hypothetical protein
MPTTKDEIRRVLDGLVETLAAIEHQRWAHWQQYVHANGKRQPDGSLVLPADLVRRWDNQIATAFADLSESEKQSDREQVGRYLPLIEDAFHRELHSRLRRNG